MVTFLALWLGVRESRPVVRRLGYLAWIAVCIQGLLGGLRVTEVSLSLAVLHGCWAHVFFCLVVTLMTVTSSRWRHPGGPLDRHPDARLRFGTTLLTAAIFGQLVLGAILRHTGSVLVLHLIGALVVAICLIVTLQCVFSQPVGARALTAPMIALVLLFGVQVVLGALTFLVVDPMQSVVWPTLIALSVPTAHTVMGTAILGTSLHVTLLAYAATRAPEETVISVPIQEAPI